MTPISPSMSLIVPGAPAGVREYDWTVKSKSMTALSIDGCTPRDKFGCKATFNGTVTLKAVDRLTHAKFNLAGNYQFEEYVRDNSRAGKKPDPSLTPDDLALRIWDASGTFYTTDTSFGPNGALINPLPISEGDIEVKPK